MTCDLNFVPRAFQPRNPNLLRVMTWNVLCDALSDSFDRVPKDLLSWQYRAPLITQHIAFLEADIICLQEVDKFNDIMQGLPSFYQGTCCMKPDGVMGCAIVWNTQSVSIVDPVTSDAYLDAEGKKQNQIYVHGLFKKQSTEFRIVCTHLKAKKGFEDIRLQQCQ